VLDLTGTQALLLEERATGTTLLAVDLANGVHTPLVSTPNAVALGVAPPSAGSAVIVASGGTGQLRLISLSGQPTVVGPTVGTVHGLATWGSLVLAMTKAGIDAIEWGLPEGQVPINLPLGPSFIGGYIAGEIDPGIISLSASDIDLSVDEGPSVATLSAAVEPASATGALRFRILCSYTPGEFHLTATRKDTGAQIGKARFRISRYWPDAQLGPPRGFAGKYQVLAQWGGGPPGPQNIGTHRASDNWRVAVVLLSTRDVRFSDVPGQKAKRREILIGGGLSVRNYYEEVSFYGTTASVTGSPTGTTISLVNGDVYGPVDLPGGWGDYFDQNGTPTDWTGWNPKPSAWDNIGGEFSYQLISEGIAEQFLRNTDAIVFVVQNASENPTMVGQTPLNAKIAWPQTFRGNVSWHTSSGVTPGVKANGFDSEQSSNRDAPAPYNF
jgi:hypothetical protein